MAVATSTMVALGLAAASAAAQAQNTKNVAKKQDQQAAVGIRKASETQRAANERINKTLQETKKSTPDDEKRTASNSYIEAIQRQMAGANAGLARRGISDQYDQMATAGQGQATDYAGTIAGLLSRIDAGAQQRQNEGNSFGNLGMDLDVTRGNVQGDAFLNDMAMKRIQRNPYIDLAAGLMSAGAGAYGSRGAGAGTGTATATLPSGMTYRAPAYNGNSWLNAYGAGGRW